MSSDTLGNTHLLAYLQSNLADVITVKMFRLDGIDTTVTYFTLFDVLGFPNCLYLLLDTLFLRFTASHLECRCGLLSCRDREQLRMRLTWYKNVISRPSCLTLRKPRNARNLEFQEWTKWIQYAILNIVSQFNMLFCSTSIQLRSVSKQDFDQSRWIRPIPLRSAPRSNLQGWAEFCPLQDSPPDTKIHINLDATRGKWTETLILVQCRND